MLELDLKS